MPLTLPCFRFPPPCSPVVEAMAGAAGYAVDNRGSSTPVAGDYPHTVVKGKKTKRLRLLHALAPRAPLAASSFTASSSGDQSAAESTTTEEEVNTANSLIMLAERPVVGLTAVDSELRLEKGSGVGEGAEAEAAAGGKVGSIAYQCRTCNKCFQSFQALGGHRASHNKQPQPAADQILEKRAMRELDGVKVSLASSSHKINTGICLPDDCGGGGGTSTTPRVLITVTATRSDKNHNHSDDGDNISNHNTTNKPRVHECAICGLEFSSGQALGGHMRRHRAPAPAPAPKKERRSILSLDLNLPAPMDVDEHASHSLGSSGNRPPLIFLPSAMVDCHH